MRHLILIVLGLLAMAGCSSNLKKENEALRAEIAEHREALQQHQQQSLEQAQRELATTDSLLEAVSRSHDDLHEWVMAHATELNDQSSEVVRLNLLRQQRDSLKERFEVLAETIKYIRKQQKE